MGAWHYYNVLSDPYLTIRSNTSCISVRRLVVQGWSARPSWPPPSNDVEKLALVEAPPEGQNSPEQLRFLCQDYVSNKHDDHEHRFPSFNETPLRNNSGEGGIVILSNEV